MTINHLDFNRRIDPYFSRLDFLTAKNAKRIAHIAIPFLSFHEGLATGISIGSAGGQIYHHLCNEAFDVHRVALLTVSAAFFIMQPQMASYATHGVALAQNFYAIASDLAKGETKGLKEKGFHFLSTAIYLASLSTSLPAIVLTSLAFQALQELKDSADEFKRGNMLEMFGKLALCLVRAAKLQEQAETFYIETYGKEITQDDWKEITHGVKKEHQESVVDQLKELLTHPFSKQTKLEKFLKKHHFKNEFKEVNFDGDYEWKTLQNFRFTDCVFDDPDFRCSHLENVVFNRCDLKTAHFAYANLNHVSFSESDISKSNFYKAQLNQCQFLNSSLERAKFNESSIQNVQIVASHLFGANFFESTVNHSLLRSCDLTDVILADAKTQFAYQNCLEHRFTMPVIALSWNFNWDYGWSFGVGRALEHEEALTMHYSFEKDEEPSHNLTKAVQEGLANCHSSKQSRPYLLLHTTNQDPSIAALYERAEKISQYADGMILPGGGDIEREFYDASYVADSDDYRNYHRSIMEYSLIDRFTEKDKPLMGICRGAQIVNTYFSGGTLKNVEGQWGSQSLEIEDTPSGNLMREKIGSEIAGQSSHHQAVDQVGAGLEVALRADDVVKCLLGKEHPILLTQFHPENFVHYDFSNKDNQERMSLSILFDALQNLKLDDLYAIIQRNEEKGRFALNHAALQHFFEQINQGFERSIKNAALLGNGKHFFDYFLELVETRRIQPSAVS